ncbi:kinase-like protein, partial [Caulochytrium protostelioides]
EVTCLMSLHHKNIIGFLGFNIQGPDLYVVTEFMERGSLFDVLAQPELLTPCTKAHMLQDAVQGVAFLHQCKPPIVHHDLKSLNLLVSQNYTVKITDFGVPV